MDPLEDLVDLSVAAAIVSPALDDDLIVPVDKDLRAVREEVIKGDEEEFKAHCLCPGNVSSICLPPLDELES